MHMLRFTIQPQTAFGTPLVGDTLFGQLCWALRHRYGNDWLKERLIGYTEGNPFLVVSDAFPRGFLPMPSVPSHFFEPSKEDRKSLKKKRWLPTAEIETNFRAWQSHAKNDREVAETILGAFGAPFETQVLQISTPQPHNTISRTTGTTGDGMFAPYSMPQIWFHPNMVFDLYAVIDESRISRTEFTSTLTDIGCNGYGRDASVGLGKFMIDSEVCENPLLKISNANAFLTLAPCAPQGLNFDPARSFYRSFTRFGRHGDIAALSGTPFKQPVLLAGTGSVFVPKNGTIVNGCLFAGQGLGGVSNKQPEAVCQGYAPVLPVHVEVPQ